MCKKKLCLHLAVLSKFCHRDEYTFQYAAMAGGNQYNSEITKYIFFDNLTGDRGQTMDCGFFSLSGNFHIHIIRNRHR